MVAALSPRLTWERNIDEATRVLDGKRKGFSAFGRNVAIARAIRRTGDADGTLKGPKTRVFWRCLCGELDEPCLDSHAMNAWFGRRVFGTGAERNRVLVGERREAARDYRRLARNLGIASAQAQAIVWIVWRERNGAR